MGETMAANLDDAVDGAASTTSPLLHPSSPPNHRHGIAKSRLLCRQLPIVRGMILPYYQESSHGRWLLASLLALMLANAVLTVTISYLNKDFYNALSAKDVTKFIHVLTRNLGALGTGSFVMALYSFQQAQLGVHWREWMTHRTLQLYRTRRVVYELEQTMEIDNPDQRIAEDIKTFTTFSLQFTILFLTSSLDLMSFSVILWRIYPELLGVTFSYAGLGTLLTVYWGRSLVSWNFAQLLLEADLRYALVRWRENSEVIAFYGGEELEGKVIGHRATSVMDNQRQINRTQRNLECFTNLYGYLVQVLPLAVVAPKYFSGSLTLGDVTQAIAAFNHIVKDLCLFINQFEELSAFLAGVERLGTFYKAMQHETTPFLDSADQEMTLSSTGTATITTEYFSGDEAGVLSIQDLCLLTPDGKRTLFEDLTVTLQQGDTLLIVGDSGVGKSSLLRAIAGLWTLGRGKVERPVDQEVYFLPQRPYCTLGTLKDQLMYPSVDGLRDTETSTEGSSSPSHRPRPVMTDDDLLEILAKVDLTDVAKRAGDGDSKKGLLATLDWSNTLSLGEQQRLAFGRILMSRPRLVILDEATSALDVGNEKRMYALLRDFSRQMVHDTGSALTYVSVGHRPSLLAYHKLRLRLNGNPGSKAEKIHDNCIEVQIENM